MVSAFRSAFVAHVCTLLLSCSGLAMSCSSAFGSAQTKPTNNICETYLAPWLVSLGRSNVNAMALTQPLARKQSSIEFGIMRDAALSVVDIHDPRLPSISDHVLRSP